MKITEEMIRKAVRKLRDENVKPKDGYYRFVVLKTPMYEQKVGDFLGYGINEFEEWFRGFE